MDQNVTILIPVGTMTATGQRIRKRIAFWATNYVCTADFYIEFTGDVSRLVDSSGRSLLPPEARNQAHSQGYLESRSTTTKYLCARSNESGDLTQ